MLSVLTFRTPSEAVEKANNTAYGLSAGVWTEKGSRILSMASRLRAGVVWANTFNRFDPSSPFGGYKESGSAARADGTAWRHTWTARATLPTEARTSRVGGGRLAVRKTYKLYLGGAFPRSESGRSYPVSSPRGELLAHAAQASRKDVRDAVVAARKAFAGWSGATGLQPRAGAVPGRRAAWTAGASSSSTEVQAAEGGTAAAARRQVDAAIDRWVHYAGWADKYPQIVGGDKPGRRPVLRVLAARTDRRRRRARPAGLEPARARLGARPGADDRQYRGGRGVAGPTAARRLAHRGAGYLRRAGRRGQPADRLHCANSRRGWPRTAT